MEDHGEEQKQRKEKRKLKASLRRIHLLFQDDHLELHNSIERSINEDAAIPLFCVQLIMNTLHLVAIICLGIMTGYTLKYYPCREHLQIVFDILLGMSFFLAIAFMVYSSTSRDMGMNCMSRSMWDTYRKMVKEKHLSHPNSSTSSSHRSLDKKIFDSPFHARKFADLGITTMSLVSVITMLVLLLLHLYPIFLFVMILKFYWIFANIWLLPRDSLFSYPCSLVTFPPLFKELLQGPQGITSSSKSSLVDYYSYIYKFYVKMGYRIHNSINKSYSKLMKKLRGSGESMSHSSVDDM